jgi:hypothetical protein
MRRPLILVAALALLATACNEKKSDYGSSSSGVSTTKLKSLHRGELSAIETYRQAIEKEGSAAGALSGLQQDHRDAADRLRERIVALGGAADTNAGVWGGFTKAIEGSAKVFGNKAAMEILKTGENHGISEYEEALADKDVDSASKDLIRNTLLPRQRAHVATLDGLLSASN